MSELVLREMTKADLPVVTTIESECQSHPWSLLQFLEGFNAGHECRVACLNNRKPELIIGFVISASVLDEATLLNIGVSPDFQNRGYGGQILQSLLEILQKKGVVNLFLEVRASNTSAIRLYESRGFTQISVRKDYYPAVVGREDGIVYSLSLPAVSSS